jgi:hypothetical protein
MTRVSCAKGSLTFGGPSPLARFHFNDKNINFNMESREGYCLGKTGAMTFGEYLLPAK